MKFFMMLTLLAVSGIASAQMGSDTALPTASGTSVTPDSSGTMNSDADMKKNKNIDSTRTEQQKMEDSADRGLDSAEGSINNETDMNTVPSQNPSMTTP
jgi:hypothetical protein